LSVFGQSIGLPAALVAQFTIRPNRLSGDVPSFARELAFGCMVRPALYGDSVIGRFQFSYELRNKPVVEGAWLVPSSDAVRGQFRKVLLGGL